MFIGLSEFAFVVQNFCKIKMAVYCETSVRELLKVFFKLGSCIFIATHINSFGSHKCQRVLFVYSYINVVPFLFCIVEICIYIVHFDITVFYTHHCGLSFGCFREFVCNFLVLCQRFVEIAVVIINQSHLQERFSVKVTLLVVVNNFVVLCCRFYIVSLPFVCAA